MPKLTNEKRRCCPRWHKDFCDCVQAGIKAYRKRKAAANKIPFGKHQGTAYYSLKSEYLKELLANGISDKEVERKIIEVLTSRKCDFTVGIRSGTATDKQCAYIAGLEKKLKVPPNERTDLSAISKSEAIKLIDNLLERLNNQCQS